MSDILYPNTADPRELLTRAHNRGHRHAFLPFWITMLTQVPSFACKNPRIFEYGSVSTTFSFVAKDATAATLCDGIVLDDDTPPEAASPVPKTAEVTSRLSEREFRDSPLKYDLGFSYELLSLTPHLLTHAKLVHSKLCAGGAYYTSLCWHKENPLAERFVTMRIAKQRSAFLHTIDEVAQAFHSAGFEVGLKRLPIDFFLIYDPATSSARYGSASGLLSTWHAHAVLFSFRKHTLS